MATTSQRRRPRNIIGERVREARLRLDPPLTQDQLSGKLAAEGLQIDRVAVAKIERGIRRAFDFEVKALATVLRVEPDWLLGGGSAKGTGRSPNSREGR